MVDDETIRREFQEAARAIWEHVLTPAQRRGLIFVRDGLEVNIEGSRTLQVLVNLRLVEAEYSIGSENLRQSGSGAAISLTAFGEAAIPPEPKPG